MRRHSLLGFALAALAGWTCSQVVAPPVPPGDGGPGDGGPGDGGPGDGGTDAGEDGGADAGVTCGNPLASPEMDCGTMSWAKSPVTSRRRNHQLSFDRHDRRRSRSLRPRRPRTARPDSSQTPTWLPSIPTARSAPSSSAKRPLKLAVAGAIGGLVGNVFVIAGGHSATGVTDQSFSSVIQGDGTLGPWTLLPTTGGSDLAPAHARRVGGGRADALPARWLRRRNQCLERCRFGDRQRGWKPARAWATAGRAAAAAAVPFQRRAGLANHVYLAGGLNRTALSTIRPSFTNVAQGTILADGTIGAWIDMTPLPVALATHASVSSGGSLYGAGGINNTPAEENRVWVRADRRRWDPRGLATRRAAARQARPRAPAPDVREPFLLRRRGHRLQPGFDERDRHRDIRVARAPSPRRGAVARSSARHYRSPGHGSMIASHVSAPRSCSQPTLRWSSRSLPKTRLAPAELLGRADLRELTFQIPGVAAPSRLAAIPMRDLRFHPCHREPTRSTSPAPTASWRSSHARTSRTAIPVGPLPTLPSSARRTHSHRSRDRDRGRLWVPTWSCGRCRTASPSRASCGRTRSRGSPRRCLSRSATRA